jgi:hypothetical protein
LDQPYHLDVDGNAVATCEPRSRGRQCSICRNADRNAIDKALAEGKPYTEISAYYLVSTLVLSNHLKKRHLQAAIVARVSRAAELSMDSVLDHALSVRDNATKRSDSAKESYYAPIARVTIEADKLIAGVIVDSAKLKLEQDKLQASRQTKTNVRAGTADYLRRHHPVVCECCGESIDRYLAEVAE